jgi:uncharacterized protein YukE
MTFQTSMDAMTKDATRWDDTATMLKAAASDCADMTLRTQDFSFLGGDVHHQYETVRSFMHQYLSDGQRETSEAAGALRKARDIYEGTDEDAKHSIEAAWQWH